MRRGRAGVAPAVRVRRRASPMQGRALESLGHAVEYLVDSRLFVQGTSDGREDQEAIQILMRLSRAVFAECPEVTPLGVRMKLWLNARIGRAGVDNGVGGRR